MKPRITLLTIGVDDLERALAFYRDGLDLPTKGIVGTEFEHGAVAFFDLSNGIPPMILSGEDMQVRSRIRTAICGKWHGIRNSSRETS